MSVTELTVAQLHQGFKQKKFTSSEVTKAYFDHIKAVDQKINAYLSLSEDLAMQQAEEADKVIATQKDFPMLMGVPCSIKDSILVQGQPCTCASKILENYVAPYDATVVSKLKREGAVILGKTNTDEFTMGVSTENSAFKVTKNPHDLTRVAGGSSGGSAASVAAQEAAYSLGSDTGGSVRLPASFCGIVGLNPTYGAVSRSGLIAHASSLDQIGPMAKTVEDVAEIFRVISGKDPLDATSVELPEIRNSKFEIRNLRIGIPKEYFSGGIEPEVEAIIKNAIAKAKEQGAKIIDISLPHTKYAIACYYIIVPSEASANLARFDGIRYGYSAINNKQLTINNLLEVYVKSRGEGFGPEPKRRILIGTHALSSGYYDAYYKKAQEVRQLIRQDFVNAFKKVDVIFSPVSPFPAFKVGEKANDPLSMYLVDIYTSAVKLAGIPALSLPAGKIGNPAKGQSPRGAGLPVGLQIIGNYFEEATILGVASEMENVVHPVK